ncbi:hypothetical protein OZZ14_00695 [Acinetobacter baumannii]|uniref:hypothetical protein n=1 Tax=Acinetobacter baumannii TaxID=470 RepID=UPI0022862623|nr:hypothetical protein [Acinetobacter baumannii]MCZ0696046.1 hypothetical protein [Acinetobacter baumannii]
MDKKTRNLELEAWLIETTGEEMMANHLGPNWKRFNDEFGFYPNISMTIADQVWQRQQAKVEELQKRVDAALELLQKPVIVGEPSSYVCELFKELEQVLKGEG